MKTNTISAALLLSFCFYFANTTVITVSNSPSGRDTYTTIQAGIDATSVDDTVYVHGSPIIYAGAAINKRITLIGAGYNLTGMPYTGTNVTNYPNLIIDNVAYSEWKINYNEINTLSSNTNPLPQVTDSLFLPQHFSMIITYPCPIQHT